MEASEFANKVPKDAVVVVVVAFAPAPVACLFKTIRRVPVVNALNLFIPASFLFVRLVLREMILSRPHGREVLRGMCHSKNPNASARGAHGSVVLTSKMVRNRVKRAPRHRFLGAQNRHLGAKSHCQIFGGGPENGA